MNVGALINELIGIDPSMEIEIATQPNPDVWYEVADVEVMENFRGIEVLVLNTD